MERDGAAGGTLAWWGLWRAPTRAAVAARAMINSLRFKLFIVSCIVQLAVVTGVTAFFTFGEVTELESRLHAKSASYSQMLFYPAAASLAFDDVEGARETLSPAASDPDVLSLAIRRLDGSVFFEQRGAARGGAMPALSVPLTSIEGRIGTFEVRVSRARMDEQRDRALAASVGVGLLALVTACATFWLIGTSFGRRLARVTAHAVDIGAELPVAPLGDENKDEIGVLSRAFDRMTSNLEERVHRRTEALVTAEQELRAALGHAAINEELNRAIIEHAADGIVTTDTLGTVKSWNAATENIFAVPAYEAIGRPLTDFLRQHTRSQSEETITRADGSVTQVDARFTDIEMTTGVLHVAFLRDLVHEKQAARMLGDMHEQLVDASRLAGMADVASGILHNVGNVLNSVNVSATILDDTLRRSCVESVGKLGALLRSHEHDLAGFFANDPRGQRVPDLVDMITSKLGNERERLVTEVVGLRKNIEHIREIVSMQQKYTKKSGVEQHVQLHDTINDAVEMSLDSKGNEQIEVVRELEPVPVMLLDRHLAMQILVNLLRNARHSVRDSQRVDPRITVRASVHEGTVKVVVEDNGVGIEPSAFERLFQQGFTTKEDGHGYGLHSSANAAKTLGGTLFATSDGKGLSASFVLELPLAPGRR